MLVPMMTILDDGGEDEDVDHAEYDGDDDSEDEEDQRDHR